jgi:hypothetical protein
MESDPAAIKFARTSLTLGILGWILYILQWCFDLTVGLLLALGSGGASAICGTLLDFLPMALWLIGIVTGHIALGNKKHLAVSRRSQAVWGLLLGYTGMAFSVLIVVVFVSLIAAGIGVGVLDKLLPGLTRH